MTEHNHENRSVFISYSRKDHEFVRRLRQDLKTNEVDYWVDQEGILPGASNWERMIRKAIQDASMMIFVVSPHAIDSNAVQGELALAELYGLTIYPVWVDGNNFVECVPLEMSRAQYIDMRGDSYLVGIGQLLDAIKQKNLERAFVPATVQPLPEGKDPRNPYKGLNAFREDDAGDFFGRERLVSDLIQIVESRMQTSERLVALIGPSGSGKSSVVMAGLLPKLKKGAIPGSEKWLYLEPFTPNSDPLEELTAALKEQKPPNYKAIRRELEQSNGLGLMKIAYDLVQDSGRYVVVYIDQFEELFAQVDNEQDRAQFINNIVAAATHPESPVIIVLTLRADFYDRPMSYNELANLIQNNNRSVLPLTLSELKAAIIKPAQLEDVQLEFEGELAAEIVFDLLEFRVPAHRTTSLAGALPLLQFALLRLYQMRDGNKLRLQAYQDMKRVSGAIGSHAEEQFRNIAQDENSEILPIWEKALNRVFYYLVNVDEQGSATRRRSPKDDIIRNDTSAEKLVDLLIENRLLVVGAGGELEVAHEALLRSWERLAEWIDQNARHLQWLQKVQAAAVNWARDEKPDHKLWRYEDLQPVYEAMSHFEGIDIEFDSYMLEFVRPQMDRLLEDFETTPEYRQMGIIDRWREIGADSAAALVRALTYAKGEMVIEAIDEALWQEPEAAEKALIHALGDEDPNVREATAEAVGRLGVVNAVDALVNNIKNPACKANLAEIESLYTLVEFVQDRNTATQALLDVLKDNNRTRDERCSAARTLGELVSRHDNEATNALISLLEDGQWQVREAVAEALGNIRNTRAVQPLIDRARAHGETYHVVRASVEALGHIGRKQAMTAIVNAAVDKKEDVRRAAVQALTELDPESALSMLMYRLRDDVTSVRQATATALGSFAHAHAVRPLMDALQSEESAQARVTIVEALSNYHDRWDVVPLLRKTLHEDTPAVRAAAARALSKMKEQQKANTRALLTVLDERKLPPDVKTAVMWALGQMQAQAAVKPLLKELRQSRRWQTRAEAALALAEIEDKSILGDVREILEGKDSDAAFSAAVVLASLDEHTERVKRELLSALSDPRKEIRCIAASALGKLKDPETLNALLTEMRNQDATVRESAADAVRRVDDEAKKAALDELNQHVFMGVRKAAQQALR